MTAATAAKLLRKPLILLIGAPYGTRTRVTAVKGRCPRPLDEGRGWNARAARYKKRATYRGDCRNRQASGQFASFAYHFPVLGIEVQGSLGGSGAPFCRSSIECLSGERTKAMVPSRGGRLIVTPAFISFSQSA